MSAARAAARRAPVPATRRARLPTGSLVATAGAAAAALSLAQSFVVAPLRGSFGGEFEDFRAYLDAGRAVAAGHSPYAGFDAGTVTMSGFDYPPLAAWLVRPVAGLPGAWPATVWLWIALAALVAGAVVAARTLLPAAWPRTRLALVASSLFAPATYNLWHGQMNTVVFLLLALAAAAWVRGAQVPCGALLGLAAGIKVAPLLLVLLLLRRRWWRGALAAGLTGLATLVAGALLLGPATTVAWFRDVLPTLGRDNGWLYNQSWNGVLSRLGDHAVLAPAAASTWVRAGALLLGLLTLWPVLRAVGAGERPPEVRGAEFGAGIVAMLLVGSIAWYPHEVHLLIPLAAAAALVASGGVRAERRLTAALGACLLVVGVAAPLAIGAASMDRIVSLRGSGLWWPALQLCSLPALAMAALLLALTGAMRRRRAPVFGSRRAGVDCPA